jgi:hypothetical protein
MMAVFLYTLRVERVALWMIEDYNIGQRQCPGESPGGSSGLFLPVLVEYNKWPRMVLSTRGSCRKVLYGAT